MSLCTCGSLTGEHSVECRLVTGRDVHHWIPRRSGTNAQHEPTFKVVCSRCGKDRPANTTADTEECPGYRAGGWTG